MSASEQKSYNDLATNVKDLRKLLLIEKIYLIEILKDIYCMWRQPFCTNPSICPGDDFWRGAGLTQKGAETIGYLFNNFKQDNNIQALLEKHILIPEFKTNNLMFQDLDGTNRTKLIPASVSSELRAHKSGLFRRSWTIWLTTRFFSLCVKIHPKRNIPSTTTDSTVTFENSDVQNEIPPITIHFDCIDFEDLPDNKEYTHLAPNNNFISEGVRFEVIDNPPFNSPNGIVKVNPSPGINILNDAKDYGKYLRISNKTLKVDIKSQFTTPIYSCCFNYGEHGGNVFLSVNGKNIGVKKDLIEYHNIKLDVNGDTVDDIIIMVTKIDESASRHHGVVTISSLHRIAIESIEIAGQELFIDKLCIPCEPKTDIPTNCIDFEDIPANTIYKYDSTTNQEVRFTSENVVFNVEEINGFNTGNIKVMPAVTPNKAEHFNQCLNINNQILTLKLENNQNNFNTIDSCCFNYGDDGGKVYLSVNGANIGNKNNFMEYHNTNIGGATITVTETIIRNNNDIITRRHGIVKIVGGIKYISVGGQELYVDNWCIPCPN